MRSAWITVLGLLVLGSSALAQDLEPAHYCSSTEHTELSHGKKRPARTPVHYLNAVEFQGARTRPVRVDLRRYADPRDRAGQAPELVLGVAINGGGYRAANYGYGVMRGLAALPGAVGGSALAEVDYFSTVSGGNYPVALYLSEQLGADGFAFASDQAIAQLRQRIREFLLIGRSNRADPDAQSPPRKSGLTRMARKLDRNLLLRPVETKRDPTRMEDLFCLSGPTSQPGPAPGCDDGAPAHPFWTPNAALLPSGATFPMTPDVLESIGARRYAFNRREPWEMARYPWAHTLDDDRMDFPVALSIAASSAVPGPFPSLVLQEHSGEAGWQNINLTDGGFSDRYGVKTALDLILQDLHGLRGGARGASPLDPADRAAVILVDSKPYPEAWDAVYSSPLEALPLVKDAQRAVSWAYEALRFSANYGLYDALFGDGAAGRRKLAYEREDGWSYSPFPCEVRADCEALNDAARGGFLARLIDGGLDPEKIYLFRARARHTFGEYYPLGPDGDAECWVTDSLVCWKTADVELFRAAVDVLINPREWDALLLARMAEPAACLEALYERFEVVAKQPTDTQLEAGVSWSGAGGDRRRRQRAHVEAGYMVVYLKQHTLARTLGVERPDDAPIMSAPTIFEDDGVLMDLAACE